MVSALTFTQSDEAIGFVRAAGSFGLPAVDLGLFVNLSIGYALDLE